MNGFGGDRAVRAGDDVALIRRLARQRGHTWRPLDLAGVEKQCRASEPIRQQKDVFAPLPHRQREPRALLAAPVNGNRLAPVLEAVAIVMVTR